jgi:hypothetical protein
MEQNRHIRNKSTKLSTELLTKEQRQFSGEMKEFSTNGTEQWDVLMQKQTKKAKHLDKDLDKGKILTLT